MDTAQELESLRRLLDAFKSGSMKFYADRKDVTEKMMADLKPDIAYLESVLVQAEGERGRSRTFELRGLSRAARRPPRLPAPGSKE